MALRAGPRIGLNCPYLLSGTCAELRFPYDADDLWLVRNNDPRAWHAACTFVLADLANLLPFAPPPMAMGHTIWECAKARPWAPSAVAGDQKRTGSGGYVEQRYKMACYTTNSVWGFDPREIKTPCVTVWTGLSTTAPQAAPPGAWRALQADPACGPATEALTCWLRPLDLRALTGASL